MHIVPNQTQASELGELPMFSGLSEHHLSALARCATTVEAKPKECLFREGDPADGFLLVKKGRVKMRRISHSGHEVILHLASPPHMIGCRGLTQPNSIFPADAVALDPVVAIRFMREKFLAIVADQPDVFFGLLVNITRRLGEIYTLHAAQLEPVEQRIATLLLQQSLPRDVELTEWKNEPLSGVRLTKNVIASIVGTTTETAIRIMSKWKKKGMITSQRGMISIRKPALIFELSRGHLKIQESLDHPHEWPCQ